MRWTARQYITLLPSIAVNICILSHTMPKLRILLQAGMWAYCVHRCKSWVYSTYWPILWADTCMSPARISAEACAMYWFNVHLFCVSGDCYGDDRLAVNPLFLWKWPWVTLKAIWSALDEVLKTFLNSFSWKTQCMLCLPVKNRELS